MKRTVRPMVIFLVCLMASSVFFVKTSNASIYLNVPWISQMDCADDLGTCKPGTTNVNDWSKTMNCGPTALVMAMNYLRGWGAPTNQDIKNLDDWLKWNELISAINNYNLVKGEGTGAKDLMAAAKYYYGWWNVKHCNERNLELLHNSLLKGRPVIVGVKTKMSNASSGDKHWMLLVGMDDNYVYVNDPGKSCAEDNCLYNGYKGGQTYYSISTFLTSWATQNYCAIIFEDNYRVGEYSDGWHNHLGCENYNYPISQPFVDYYLNNGTDTAKGPDFFGYPAGPVHKYESDELLYNYKVADLWVQDYPDSGYLFILNRNVYNVSLNFIGIVYSVHGRIRDYWEANYYVLGAPVTNEYFYPEGTKDYVVQWFEPSEESYIAVIYDNKNGTFTQCTIADVNCPPYDPKYFDQYKEINTGYDPGGYGLGGSGDTQDYYNTTNTYYTLSRYTTCLDVIRDSSGNFAYPYDPVGVKDVFYPTDGRVAYWLEFTNLSKQIYIEWKWYDADNNLVSIKSDYAGDNGVVYNWWRTWEYVSISKTQSFGSWRIEVYVDGKLVIKDYFTVTINLSPPQNLRSTQVDFYFVDLAWDSVNLATAYRLYRNGVYIGQTSQLTWKDENVRADTNYEYKVYATRGDIISPASNILKIKTLPDLPPSKPKIIGIMD